MDSVIIISNVSWILAVIYCGYGPYISGWPLKNELFINFKRKKLEKILWLKLHDF